MWESCKKVGMVNSNTNTPGVFVQSSVDTLTHPVSKRRVADFSPQTLWLKTSDLNSL